MSEKACGAERCERKDRRSARQTTLLAGAAMAGVLVLNACAGVVQSTASQDVAFRTGVLSTFAYAAAVGEMNTVIVGNPFNLPEGQLDRAVTEAMQGNHYGPRTTFTTTPSADARSQYRIVMMFDRPRAQQRQQVCGPRESLIPEPDAARLRLTTAFCARNQLLSWVESSIARPGSPDEPSFRRMIASATFNLIPARDDDSGNRRGITVF